MDPVSAGVIFAIAAGGMSATAAREQNRNARDQAEMNKLSLDASTEAQLNESARAFRASMGSNQAASATRGGSSQDLGLGILGAFLGNESNIKLNQIMGNAQIDSQRAAQSVNPLTSILSGMLSGYQTGQQIGAANQQNQHVSNIQKQQKVNSAMNSFMNTPSAWGTL